MSVNTFFLNIVDLEKKEKLKEKKEKLKDKKEKISPRSRLPIKRNESWESFIKFSWGWIS